MFIQELYVFFSASTARWTLLENIIKDSEIKKKLLPKRLNTTRWSAKWHASRALLLHYWEFHKALQVISGNPQEKPENRATAEGLCAVFTRIETAILLVLWNDVLERFNAASKTLQSTNTDLGVICNIYKSLKDYVQGLRERFNYYEMKGMKLCKSETADYVLDFKRRRKKKQFSDDENNDEDTSKMDLDDVDGRQDMIINTFYVIIDRIFSELENRSRIYFNQNKVFGFIYKLLTLKDDEIREKSSLLVQKYPTDLSSELIEEFVHFKVFVEALDLNVKDHHLPAEFLRFIREKQLTTLFPNVETSLRILLCMMTTNASGERSFSILKRVKNYLRNSSADLRLSSLTSFVANAELLNEIDFSDIIKDFSAMKARKVDL